MYSEPQIICTNLRVQTGIPKGSSSAEGKIPTLLSMAASPSPVTNQWMQILWNPDFDFAVQVIDSQLFATVISLITTTVALNRHFKCQNRDFFFNWILYYGCIQTWQASSTSHLTVKAAVSLISMPNSLNSCPYAFFPHFSELSPLHNCLHFLWEEASFPEGKRSF